MLDNKEFDRLTLALAAVDRGAPSAPSAEELAAAPLLENWLIVGVSDAHAIMLGDVAGHPELGSEEITTSHLMLLDPERKYMRTTSRWYRLGAPLPVGELGFIWAMADRRAEKMGITGDAKQEVARAMAIHCALSGFHSVTEDEIDGYLEDAIALQRKEVAEYCEMQVLN